jgi:hypothetical protein
MSTRFSLLNQFKVYRNTKDARKSTRKTVRSQGWIRLEGDFAVRPCMIVDMSYTGVRLQVETPNCVVNSFTLLRSRRDSAGLRCQVKWRRGEQLGVAFM